MYDGELILFGQATFEYSHTETFEIAPSVAGGGVTTAISRKSNFGLRGSAPPYTPVRERAHTDLHA